MFANGYRSNPVIEKINIDTKVKCNTCKVVKTIASFSKKNQYYLKERIYKARQAGKTVNTTLEQIIPCMSCTPQQQFEFLCHGCQAVKGRDKFSKAQLRNPDTAYCWQCMEKRLNMEPGDNDDDNSDCSDDSGDNSDTDTAKAPSTMAGISRGGTSNSNSNSTAPAAPSVASGSGLAKFKGVQRKAEFGGKYGGERGLQKLTDLSLAAGVTSKDKDDVQVADSESDSDDE
ncbi:Stc1 domain [Teratosphaeria destructans]|uniref:Stc1 domain n=1 Tax=Teratosphaeria destructans TaxID=418781 RepID=A0A9W7SKH0_9PEZI|nr:Stc1 domain [Teratosphaeria destructans]